MLGTDFPNKTPAGYAEIQNRKMHLNSRQRTLLISIDGAHSIEQVREQFRALGDVTPLIEELCAAGLVLLNQVSGGTAPARAVAAAVDPDELASMHRMPPLGLARQFMNETTVAAVGLRAFMFTLKLERCSTKAELLDLLPEYRRQLGKAKAFDSQYAETIAARAKEMLNRI